MHLTLSSNTSIITRNEIILGIQNEEQYHTNQNQFTRKTMKHTVSTRGKETTALVGGYLNPNCY